MSTTAGTTQGTDLGHDVISMLEMLKTHVSHLTDNPHRFVRVKVGNAVHVGPYIDVYGTRYRATPHGLVERRLQWRTVAPLGHSAVCLLPLNELAAIRNELFKRIKRCQDGPFAHGL